MAANNIYYKLYCFYNDVYLFIFFFLRLYKYTQFIVEKNGSIYNFEGVSGIKLDLVGTFSDYNYLINEEVITIDTYTVIPTQNVQ